MRQLILAFSAFILCLNLNAQGYTNPIVKGFNPDPSVCRVGDDYYMVTSTFHYFPGVPLYHSKDLVNWEHIGHVLDRESQLPLPDAHAGQGIFAPTIRYHEGTFYMITTNCSGLGNFIVSTKDPYGAWSDPVTVDMPGIDPDLFWDEDGKCYYSGSANDNIMFCQINPDTGEKLTTPKIIWNGTGGRYPEAPHIYKKDGWYYLMIAEGGTEYAHGVTIARSRNVDGPYTPAPHNPIITHCKQATQTNPIQGTGHADIIQAHDGSWWMVCLGFRTQSGMHHLLGRESFLAPVTWDRGGWPVVNGNGDIAINMDVPTLPQKPFPALPERNEFDVPAQVKSSATMASTGLGNEWSWLRNPDPSRYLVADGKLRIHGVAADLNAYSESPSFAGIRQQHHDFTAETCVKLGNARSGDKVGMSIFMDSGAHYDVYIEKKGGKNVIGVRYAMGVFNNIEEIAVSSSKVWLRVSGDPEYYRLWYSTDGKEFKQAGIGDTRYLSSETVGGFTGIMIGLWAQSPSEKGHADFEYFEYNAE